MSKYARRTDDLLAFKTVSQTENGYPITIEVASTNVGFYAEVGSTFPGFAVHFTDSAWDDFVTIVNYIDQVVLKTKE